MSLLLVKSNALFLHIPKTAGTWVEAVLNKCNITNKRSKSNVASNRHALSHQYLDTFNFTFSFVRHPLTWYESWWKYQAGIWKKFEVGVWHPQRILEICESNDFNEFIRLCLQYEPAYVTRMYEWYLGPSQCNFVNYIGKYENIREDLIKVLNLLSYDFDENIIRQFDPVNISQNKLGEDMWDAELKLKIMQIESSAINRFYGSNII